ncbi:unnamed protein product [Adineta steineri]|uniref:NHL repeat containing protein n=1 Tax=Adineta steineri TaxID=433720 RepID=A0A814G1M9_9BILA|nr:unnamed protein product [Adineta steineri]CAF0990174.1 unnamed protein product [Adineta steineri]
MKSEILLALPFNQPWFCPAAIWNSDGITFADQSIVGSDPYAIFVNTNNTIYVANRENSTILIWHEESVNPIKIISGSFIDPSSLFVTSNGDIYIDDGFKNGRVERWIVETNTFVTVMNVSSRCDGLFVDINDTLYCSMYLEDQVMKRSLNDPLMTSNCVAAGTGIEGSASNELDGPGGIFVDVNFDLYVADCGNDRIQLFQLGESNGITVAGSESLKPTTELYYPTAITLDAEKYLFIVDNNNHRIVGSSLNGFQCLVGCYGMGSQSNQLNSPLSFSFDRSGNMFITDTSNSRIQKFEYLEESCVDNSLLIKSMYSSSLTPNSSIYFQECSELGSYYEAIQMNVTITGYYAFLINSEMKTMGAYIYTNNFNPFDVSKNVLSHSGDSDNQGQFKITAALQANMIYVVVITTSSRNLTENVSIQVSGPNCIDFNRICSPSAMRKPYLSTVQSNYSSELTMNSQTYSRDCRESNYYYQTIRVNIVENAYYALSSDSTMDTYGYIYKDDFNPLNPFENLLSQNYRSCSYEDFNFIVYLHSDTKYILVVTTSSPNKTGKFSILTSGPNNITLDPYTQSLTNCFIGQKCQFYKKSIGVTLDDILRDQTRPNITMTDQTILVKINAALTMIMFIGALSLNQPKFPPSPIWDSNGITFADQSIVGSNPYAIFVNTNNTIYVANRENSTIVIWHKESVNPTKIITGNFIEPRSLFVASNGDIYIGDSFKNGRIQRWIIETNTFVTVMNVSSRCDGLFVDINNTLYCSMYLEDQVVKISLNDPLMTSNSIAAGTGIKGSASNELDSPGGIFVDVNLDLYVTDCENNRVQLFQLGESNGITVAGSESLNPTITLNCPKGIILDSEKYLFIVDLGNSRIVGSSMHGFRCLVGCYGEGSQSNQLDYPFSFSFDHSGNMFVTDRWNDRIQKFLLMNDSFALSFNQPRFSPTPIWNSNGITFANRSIVGSNPYAIFVNTNNTIYVANRENSTIIIWHKQSVNPTKIIHGNFTDPFSLFVTPNGDIYIDDGDQNGRVQRWRAETDAFAMVMNVSSRCDGLFVDIYDTLYCSIFHDDQVVKRSLSDPMMLSNRVAAGTGFEGSDSDELDGPGGIFVDVNLDLYVTDCENNRVQLFQLGESNGITVAGSESLNPTITLDCPNGIILDAEKYLFIVDLKNHRIVGSDLNGFRCLAGCYRLGSQSNQLYNPFSFSFDHSGNMFVTDQLNHRIQKFLLMNDSFALSFNQPRFCPTAIWNSNGITFADQSIVGSDPYAIFVNTNNTIYVANGEDNTIVIWHEESVNPTKIIHGNFTNPSSLFVTPNGDIYIDDGDQNGRVQRWRAETDAFAMVMNVSSRCDGLFVDIYDTLYCSMYLEDQVVKRSLNDPMMLSNRVAAGTGFEGSDSDELDGPGGIFVDVNLDLYVADCYNDRVQLFQLGESNGITVAGRKSLNPPLDCPNGIVLDVKKYLFIVDTGNHRIVGSGVNGFRCLVGCYGEGSQSTQLDHPFSFSFDHSGNMFVTDRWNDRIQKFEYLEELCEDEGGNEAPKGF